MNPVRKIFSPYLTALLSLVAGIVFLAAAVASRTYMRDPERVAAVAERQISSRLSRLDRYIEKAMLPDSSGWMRLDNVPDEMVIYKYMYDTLQSWVNEFVVSNDDIGSRYYAYHRLGRPEYGFRSQLLDVGAQWGFINIGPHWYVARTETDGVCRVIAALKVCSVNAEGLIDDINPHLHIPEFYTVRPVTGYVGTEVGHDGHPLFLIVNSAPDTTFLFANSRLRWIGLGFIVLATMLMLLSVRKPVTYLWTAVSLFFYFLLSRLWGAQMADTTRLFSPSVYAGSQIWSSFGDLALINLLIILETVALYLVWGRMLEWAGRRCMRIRHSLLAMAAALLAVGTLVYIILSIISLVQNSTISLELQCLRGRLGYAACSIVMYTLLFCMVMLLLNMSLTAVGGILGQRLRAIAPATVGAAAVIATSLMFGLSSHLGFVKEEHRAHVWANRLAVDRDLWLELYLRGVDAAISQDEACAMLSSLEGAGNIIVNRLKETYFRRYANEYDISVSTCRDGDMDGMILLNRRLSGGSPVADNSNFVCIYHNNGRSSYAGLFTYVMKDGTQSRMLVEIISKSSREDNGYLSIFTELERPGNVMIPEEYSYAKYVDGKLISYKGTYAYPTVISDNYRRHIDDGRQHFRSKAGLHFINLIDEGEVIFISRPRRTALQNASAFLTMLVLVIGVMYPVLLGRRKKKKEVHNTFRRRISIVLTCAIFASLVTLASISIRFVFERNRADTYNLMSSKISTVQTMVEALAQDAVDYSSLLSQEFRSNLLSIAANTRSDVTLYSTSGRVFVSTVSDIFDRNLLSTRISGRAYDAIVNGHERIYISREEFNGRVYYALYAPVFNRSDEMVAIVSTPYNAGSSLMREAIPHAALLLILVLTLLAIFSVISTSVVNAVFAPLIEVSRKMEGAAEGRLDTIEYGHDDEISSLIASYNRMVHDLEESTRKMAENERDMAWSEMARQVAHEIKNPLTPMKLSLQRLIRLKENNNPAWNDRFDDLSKVILEQIENLTDTANDFSSFAKLYTEDPVEVDLDTMIKEQLLLFDSRENVELTYIGMPDAWILAPKPQLIRVLVNLVTNSIQAIEIEQKECLASGGEVKPGKVNILLRKSSRDGFYDVVVEDNGPGVSEENQDKLFTPKFTTKSSGSGLGLAISRNIILKCGGDIRYRRSYTLGGASFDIALPMRQTQL